MWRRWDLHIHAPGTKLANGYGDADSENLKTYVDRLEASDVAAFGITDYFSFDGFRMVKAAYDKAYPDGRKLLIPNIEFRLTETISSDGKNVDTHVLIDPQAATDDKLNTLLSDLPTHITRNDGEEVRCKDLESVADFEQATVGLKALKAALAKVFPDEATYIVITNANNDGLRGVDSKSPRSLSISDELDKASHGFFGSSKNASYFLDKDRYEGDAKAKKKPVYSYSDAHSFDDLERLTGDEQGYEATWIKADLTFRGLRQTLFEPKGRVHIGERPTVLERYLPQNYFESLTNEIEVKAFRREIEEVVFSHVDESDRMGRSSFSELEDLKTSQSRTDISALKSQLRELNIEIVDLEEQADPDTKARLREELDQRKKEYNVLEKSKPKVVEKPETETETEEQRAITEQIESTRKILADITSRGKEAVEKLSTLKSDLVDLGGLKESLASLNTRVTDGKEELKSVCKRFGLDIDAIVSFKIDMSSVDERIKAAQAEVKSLEADYENEISDNTDLNGLRSVPALRKAHQFLTDKLTRWQETLSAPQKRYQRYVQALSEVTTKMLELMGGDENPKPGTIKYIEFRIKYIEEELSAKLDGKCDERDKMSRSIFKAKKKVRQFYEGLKTSVEKKLEFVRKNEHGEVVFDVTIDASFVPSHEFADEFFVLLNQSASGPFRGAAQGRMELDLRISEVDWNDVESVLAFAKGVIVAIKEDDVKKQVKDVKRFYDLLFSFEYFSARYELRLSGKNLNQLSPGEKGLLLLIFYLHLDMEKTPLIIDQPEDNLDNDSIFSVLAHCIRQAKKTRQVVLVTHNPNLAVGADAEQIIYVSLDKADNYKFAHRSGSIEYPRINDLIVKILEGSRPAFVQRRLVYQIK